MNFAISSKSTNVQRIVDFLVYLKRLMPFNLELKRVFVSLKVRPLCHGLRTPFCNDLEQHIKSQSNARLKMFSIFHVRFEKRLSVMFVLKTKSQSAIFILLTLRPMHYSLNYQKGTKTDLFQVTFFSPKIWLKSYVNSVLQKPSLNFLFLLSTILFLHFMKEILKLLFERPTGQS